MTRDSGVDDVWPVIGLTASHRLTRDWDDQPQGLAQIRVSTQYADSIYRAGGQPVVLPTFTGAGSEYIEGRGYPAGYPRKVAPLAERAKMVVSRISALVLTGGGDVVLKEQIRTDPLREMDRDRDFWEAALFEEALSAGKPILGICRGLQLMNLVLGGTLWRDIPSEYHGAICHQQTIPRARTSHVVRLEPDSQLAGIVGATEIMVNSGHHQAAREPAEALRVAGRSSDGLIEVLEHRTAPFVMAVQWHPEALAAQDESAAALFVALVKEAVVKVPRS